jgi:hypothetical protein
MRMRRTLAFLLFGFCVLAVAVKGRTADVRSGDWTIHKSEEGGKVEFSLIEHRPGIRLADRLFSGCGFFKVRAPGSTLHRFTGCRQDRV